MEIRSITQNLDDLESGGLLALDAVGVDRVDEVDRVVVRQFTSHLEAVVEVPLHLDELCAVGDGLSELAERDLALGHEHGSGEAGMGGIGRRAGGGVSGRGTDDRFRAVLGRLGHGHGHAAVLERTRRVYALVFDPDLRAGAVRQRVSRDERSSTLAEGDDRGRIRDVEAVGIFAENSAPLVGH